MSPIVEHVDFTVRGKDRAELLDAVHKRILEYAGDSEVDHWVVTMDARPYVVEQLTVLNGGVIHWHAEVTISPKPSASA